MVNRKPRIGLVLGGGAARGWAHIGVIRALHERGIRPDLVAGTSVGAIVGGALAAGRLDPFEEWIGTLRRRDILKLMDAWPPGGGLLRGATLMDAIEDVVGNPEMDDLSIPFGCVATELGSGREVWLREGSLMAACRASISLPGMFAPARHNGDFLLDGGLVNPVPVSMARAMGADIVIAVDLSGHLRGEHFRLRGGYGRRDRRADGDDNDDNHDNSGLLTGLAGRIKGRLGLNLGRYLASDRDKEDMSMPGLLDVIVASIDIMQDRITRSRMAGEPPDIHLTPRVGDIGLMDFDRAEACIPQGREAVEREAEEVERLVALIQGMD